MSTLLAAGHVLIGARIAPALAGMAKVNSTFIATGAKIATTGSRITKFVGLPIAAALALSVKAVGGQPRAPAEAPRAGTVHRAGVRGSRSCPRARLVPFID